MLHMRGMRFVFLFLVLLPFLGAGSVWGRTAVRREDVPVLRQRQVKAAASALRSMKRGVKTNAKVVPHGLGGPVGVGFVTATQIPVSGTGNAFVSGDFDGNGHRDLATVTQDNLGNEFLRVQLGNGDGSFQAAVTTQITFDPSGDEIRAADLNGDQKDDVVIAHIGASSGTIDVYLSNGDGTFQAPVQYADSIPVIYAFSVADANGDGNPDILLATDVVAPDSTVTTQASVLLGNGDGTFQAESVTPIPGIFSRGVFADVNGDHRLDLVTTTQVFLANPAGGFFPGVALANAPTGFATDGMIAVGDINSDQHPDIAVVNASANTVIVYLNNGDGTFRQGTTNYVGVEPMYVSIADVTGDGIADVVVGNTTSSDITILAGKNDGTFDPVTSGYVAGGSLWAHPVVADFNGDGVAEIIVPQSATNYEVGLAMLQGLSDGTFVAAQNFYSPMSLTAPGPSFGVALASADFNGDGIPDFVLGNAGGNTVGLNLFLGNGDGTFQAPQTILLGGQATGIAAGDFNKDGRLDIAIASAPSSVNILLNNGAGFGAATAYPISSYGWEIATGDLDGDGNLDLVVTQGSSNFISIFKGNGDGTFTVLPDVDLISSYANGVAIGDLNGDGRPDVVATVQDSTVGMGIVELMGNGDGTFGPPTLLASSTSSAASSSSYPGQVRMVDLNRDGKLDLVYTNQGFGTVGVMYGNGDGTFGTPNEFLVGGFPYSVVLADINGDTALDAVVGNDGYSGVTALLNYAGAKVTVSSSVDPSTPGQPVTFTATLSAVHGINSVPTGSITFKDGAAVLSTVAIVNGQASLPVANLSVGTHLISAVYAGDSSFLASYGTMIQLVSPVISQSGSYVLSANPPSAAIHPGQSASFNLTVSPVNGFSGTVNFSCGTLPAGLSCQFTPPAVIISGAQAGNTQLVVTTSANALAHELPLGHPHLPLWASFTGMIFGIAALEGMTQRKKRAVIVSAAMVMILMATMLLSGCGGAPPSSIPQGKTTTVHVVATSGNSASQTLNVTVTLQ